MIITKQDIGRQVVNGHGFVETIIGFDEDAVYSVITKQEHNNKEVYTDEGLYYINIPESYDNLVRFLDEEQGSTEETTSGDTPTTTAKRYNSNKVSFDDIPLIGLVEVGKVGASGRSKYPKNNWRMDAPLSQYLNCALRHLIKRMYGEERDSESRCLHLAHAAWNILAAIEKYLMKKEQDDLYRYETAAKIEDMFLMGEVDEDN